MASATVDVDGLVETLRAFQALELDLRREANAELRVAGREAATVLALELRSAASSSGVPVAARVATSIRVKSDRLPTVSIGGAKKVGRTGAPAAALLWGSERGPVGDPNRFAVPPNAGGYWIAPTVKRFETSAAMTIYRRAIVDLLRRHKLI